MIGIFEIIHQGHANAFAQGVTHLMNGVRVGGFALLGNKLLTRQNQRIGTKRLIKPVIQKGRLHRANKGIHRNRHVI